MNHGRFTRFILIVLFLSAAFQAVTPDPGSLASLNGLWLLMPVIAQPDQPLDDDDSPDEVCEPAARQMDAITAQVDQLRCGFHLPSGITTAVAPTGLIPLEARCAAADSPISISPPLLCRFDC